MKNKFLVSLAVFLTFSSLACGDGSVDDGCSLNSDCAEQEFCKFPDGNCNGETQKGQCLKIPEVCTQIYMPVCGCDDKTYPSQCSAESHSISIKGDGECQVLNTES